MRTLVFQTPPAPPPPDAPEAELLPSRPFLVRMAYDGKGSVTPVEGTAADPPALDERGFLSGAVWARTEAEALLRAEEQRRALQAAGIWVGGGDLPFAVAVDREGEVRYCLRGEILPEHASLSLDGRGWLSGWVWAADAAGATAAVQARREGLLQREEWPAEGAP